MVSLEQVKLLETKVIKTIEYVRKIGEENKLLKEKLNSYQHRNDELETQISQFKEDQSRIEDGILSALDRLNQFEDALDKKVFQETPDSPDLQPADEPHGEEGSSEPKDTIDINPEASENPANPDNELDIF